MCSSREILEKLSEKHVINPEEFVAYDVCKNTNDIFKTFVATILSQNSTDKATYIAFRKLEETIGVTIDSILSTPDDKLIEAIRIVGLSNSKVKYIKNIANFLKLNRVDQLIKLDCNKLRHLFTSVHGIGNKTADVVLLNCFKCETFPVDTHIKRVVSRLGIIGSKPKYDEIARFFLKELRQNELLQAHHLLILHGRRTCKARKPLCESCPLTSCCEYFKSRMGKS